MQSYENLYVEYCIYDMCQDIVKTIIELRFFHKSQLHELLDDTCSMLLLEEGGMYQHIQGGYSRYRSLGHLTKVYQLLQVSCQLAPQHVTRYYDIKKNDYPPSPDSQS